MSIQVDIFNHLKSTRNDSSLVSELSDLLSVSIDSVYRRLRGDTDITLDELSKICNHFNISIDSFLCKNSQKVDFHQAWGNGEEFNYTLYLERIKGEMEVLSDIPNSRLFYSSKDIPIFYNLLIPELAEFKGFFWEKSVAQLPHLRQAQFSSKSIDDKRLKLAEEILNYHNTVETSELWNDGVLNSTLNQIQFYNDSGFFTSDDDFIVLLEKMKELIDHCEIQAEIGCKFKFNEDSDGCKKNYNLYYSDILIGDNTIILDINEQKSVYKAHNIIDNIVTHHQHFCERTLQMHEKFLSTATLISSTNQRERVRFFNRLRKKVNALERLAV
ncbi:helix-turn-helix domain-containing protein [Fulvivirga ligni]|uniref:helix-turn-helix domain-containing protein n=1 Tax=Fulvivirga ligni TaxID=2904246 RepID=UPI001F1B1399|nr:helix-turn-helix transcriptional regulator [Fulvivirga ligni]UII19121.1 helix-turn-helix transcriptional regulator [Fulvivirga ligni]